MILKINFTKMVASGNDFVVIGNQKPRITNRKLLLLAKEICDRKYGAGADGLLILEKSRIADIKMRIFNPDGSEPKMCGNGVRCAALCVAGHRQGRQIKIETKAGILKVKVNPARKMSSKGRGLSNGVKVMMTKPKDIKLDLPIRIAKRNIKVNFINTGVPHAVIFVEGLNKINVVDIGRQIRFHKRFKPEGTNVDFVQIIDDNNIKLRTYERGVEDETLACGTGAVAAALIFAISRINPHTFWISKGRHLTKGVGVNVHTKSGEILKIDFNRKDGKFKDVRLEGKARIVYKGVYDI